MHDECWSMADLSCAARQAHTMTRFEEEIQGRREEIAKKGQHGSGEKARQKIHSDGLPTRMDEELVWKDGTVRQARGEISKENFIVGEFAVQMALEDEAEVHYAFCSVLHLPAMPVLLALGHTCHILPSVPTLDTDLTLDTSDGQNDHSCPTSRRSPPTRLPCTWSRCATGSRTPPHHQST